jgi:hypothetical protein
MDHAMTWAGRDVGGPDALCANRIATRRIS